MNNLELSIKEIHARLVNKEITPLDLVEECYEKIEENSNLNSFITVNKVEAIEYAKELSKQEVEKDNLLWGIPIAIKDNISTKGIRTTCASKMLENYIPIYDATVIDKIKSQKMIIIGKTNMDEFAMGSTSRTSYFGAPKNPVDDTKITGGSSGGSAACVAGGLVPLALGTDTGGSIRQPASYTGIVGMKPTYGRVSRYGLIAFGSSLDQIGPMTRNVYENALLLNTLVGRDQKDLTSANKEIEDFTRLIGQEVKGMKIAIPKYFVSDIVSPIIIEKLNRVVEILEANGNTVEYIDMKYLDQAVTLYQIIAMGEASSNLARFDGVKFGYRSENSSTVDEMYENTRGEGFGKEVKRRIMVGSYLLSGDNAKTYYDKALMIRNAMKQEFDKVFKEYDFILGPTTTTVAYPLDENLDDPTKSFMDDVLVIPVNMAGLPGMSIPMGKDQDNMPIGLHIIGNRFEEAKMYQLAYDLEKKLK
ncbi:MAG TPA: Asp-tRNA(Asn)/Glu-tRNA(Gln) amidotransferase subunit GatA [Candidatus Scybalousia intestinigallinarum]|nr:Asp-tRNA(Asn)/Glu-tRNA(Gln) amidotransferase subunit GatA [Candidatus Scybalousia intestinigallinarum]